MKLQYLAAIGVALALARFPIRAQTPPAAGAGGDFAPHTIGTELRGGYQVVVADLNKDGRPDVIALASGLPELVWYENPGRAEASGVWPRHVIVSGVSR